jgi:hypothetical protein
MMSHLIRLHGSTSKLGGWERKNKKRRSEMMMNDCIIHLNPKRKKKEKKSDSSRMPAEIGNGHESNATSGGEGGSSYTRPLLVACLFETLPK